MDPTQTADRTRPSGPIRSFVALELPAPLKANVAALLQRLSAEHHEFRWVSPASLHLTLKFLGDVAAAEMPRVVTALDRAAARWRQPGVGSLHWVLQGGGCFPGRGRSAKVIWVGIKAGADLTRLQQAVEDELAAEGFPREGRAFSPHLTLARSRSQAGEPAAWVEVLAGQSLGEAASMEMVLFQSILTPGGAIHEPLARVSLLSEGVRQNG